MPEFRRVSRVVGFLPFRFRFGLRSVRRKGGALQNLAGRRINQDDGIGFARRHYDAPIRAEGQRLRAQARQVDLLASRCQDLARGCGVAMPSP